MVKDKQQCNLVSTMNHLKSAKNKEQRHFFERRCRSPINESTHATSNIRSNIGSRRETSSSEDSKQSKKSKTRRKRSYDQQIETLKKPKGSPEFKRTPPSNQKLIKSKSLPKKKTIEPKKKTVEVQGSK